MVNRFEGSDDPEVTYFYDFIRLLEEQYAWASVESVAEDIDQAKAAGPAFAGLERRPQGIFILRSPIGYGHFAFVELEFDEDGVLQPVMGGFLRK